MSNSFKKMTLLTSVQIGEFCGISDRTVRDWQQKGMIPKSDDMSVIVRAIIQVKSQEHHRGITSRVKSSGDDDALTEAKIRLTNLQGDKLTLELEERRGNLVQHDQVAEVWSKYVYSSKNRLVGMPVKLAYELSGISDPTAIKQVLERAVDEVLRELSVTDGR